MAMLRSSLTKTTAGQAFLAFDQSEFRKIAADKPSFLRSPLKVVGTVQPLRLQLVPDSSGQRLVRQNANTLRVAFDPQVVGLRPDVQFKADALQIGIDDDIIEVKSSKTSSVQVVEPSGEASVPGEIEDDEQQPEGLSPIELIRWQRQRKALASRARIEAAKALRRETRAPVEEQTTPAPTPPQVDLFQAPAVVEARSIRRARPTEQASKTARRHREEPTTELAPTLFLEVPTAREPEVEPHFVARAAAIEPKPHTPRILRDLSERCEALRRSGLAQAAEHIGNLAALSEIDGNAVDAIASFFGIDPVRALPAAPTEVAQEKVTDVATGEAVAAVDETPRARAIHLITSVDGQAGWRLQDATGVGLDEAVSIIAQVSSQVENDGDTIRARSEAPAPRFDRSVLRWDILAMVGEEQVLSRNDLEKQFGEIPFIHVAKALRRLADDSFIRILPTGIVQTASVPEEPLFYRVATLLRMKPQGMRLNALRALLTDEAESEIERAATTLVTRQHVDLRDGRYVWRGLADSGDSFVDDVQASGQDYGLQKLDFSAFQGITEATPPIERTPTGAVLTAYVDRSRPSGNRYVGKDQLLLEISAAGTEGIDKKGLMERLVGVKWSTLSSYLSNLMTSNKVIKNGKKYRLLLARPSFA